MAFPKDMQFCHANIVLFPDVVAERNALVHHASMILILPFGTFLIPILT